jgi:hypothetical protein
VELETDGMIVMVGGSSVDCSVSSAFKTRASHIFFPDFSHLYYALT